MSLADKLAATRAASEKRIPPDRAAVMERATEDLRRSGILDRIVAVGSPAPAFALTSQDGRPIDSAELLAAGPMVVSFFRGSW
jgi:hypothetical protein